MPRTLLYHVGWPLLLLLPWAVSAQTLVDVPSLLPVGNAGIGSVTWIDYDRDGRQDLFFTSFSVLHGGDAPGGRLFRNEGDSFREVTDQAGIDLEIGNGLARGDYDGDGWPDLYGSSPISCVKVPSAS